MYLFIYLRAQLVLAEQQAKHCGKNSSDSAIFQMDDDDEVGGQFIDLSTADLGIINGGGSSSLEDQLSDGGIFHVDTFQVPSNRQLLFHAFCGNLSARPQRQVLCTPQPDAFK